MTTIQKNLSDLFQEVLEELYPEIVEIEPVYQSSQAKFGDYQFNQAMKLAKIVKRPPIEIAEKIKQRLHEKQSPLIDALDVHPPGFINIHLKESALYELFESFNQDPKHLVAPPKKKERVIVEFSSPNIAKELHVGHLRSTIIGDSIARIFSFKGHDVQRINHLGDWGTSFGMLIAYMKEVAKEELKGLKETTLSSLVQWYKESKVLFDTDPDFKKRAQKEVVLLQGGDKDALKAWGMIVAISKKAYQEIYDLLDIKLEDRGESFYNPMLAGVIDDLREKGMLTVSDGAKCVFLEGYLNREGTPLPLMLQKSDGGYTYDTTDMAAMKHRVFEEKAERIIIVTDSGQSLRFKMLYDASVLAGYLDPKTVRFDHVTFGVVLGTNKQKFRTRAGEVEKLIDLIEDAIAFAEKIVKERNPTEEETENKRIAKILGVGALKYADLSSHRASDYTFSLERMLRFEGNTAPFILYSFVRARSILEKGDQAPLPHSITINHPTERALILHLLRFQETIETVLDDLCPHRIAEYLFSLAEHFNAFFRDCQVIGSAHEATRLMLCKATKRCLKTGLSLLGIETVDKM